MKHDLSLVQLLNALVSAMCFHATIACVAYLVVMRLTLVLLIKENIVILLMKVNFQLVWVFVVSERFLPGYAAFILRLFFLAQYKANMAPLINDITSIANAMPDIHVVAHAPTAGSDLYRK